MITILIAMPDANHGKFSGNVFYFQMLEDYRFLVHLTDITHCLEKYTMWDSF